MYKKKVFWMMILVMICIVSIDCTVSASASQRRSTIQSRGIINYANGRVVIDASDLSNLADQTDELEISYKTDVADSLAQIGTYLQQDGSIDHNNRNDGINPQQIRYRDFTTGILKSQSVEHLAGIQASDTKALVYYAREINNILEVTNNDTKMPVFITSATEDNLTADTAAWIDGKSIIGNGADNYYFYQKGFIEGYATKVGATVEYIYDDTGRVAYAQLILPEE